jgi:hypothetical protein
MNAAYKELFRITLSHYYYTSGQCADIRIKPTLRSRQLIKDYGLLYVETAEGIAVHYPAVAGPSDQLIPLKPISEAVGFSFMLQSENPYLFNFSELPLDTSPSAIYYFNNLSANVQNGKLLVSADSGSPFVSTLDTIELRPQQFDYRADSGGATTADVEIRDAWDRSLVQETVPVVEGILNYRINLRRTSPGQFNFLVDGVSKLRFYADDQLIGRKVFGLINIYRDDSVPAAYQFTNPAQQHTVVPKTYRLEIDKRKTFWKYYVALKYRLKNQTPDEWPTDWPADWEIVYSPDPAVHIAPDAGKIKTLTDGTLAVPFIADTALPLQEAPIKSVQLKKTGHGANASGIREVDHLPNPSVKTIVPDDSDHKIYSEVFIYV